MDPTAPTTVLHDITAEVEVPPEGTLSRVLYKDDQIRVVAFAFDAGQELTDHTAAVPAVLQVLTGRLRVTLGDDVGEVGPRSWIHLPANLSHAVVALEPSIMLLTLLRS